MHKHIHPQSLAFFEETTVCTPPADWAAETALEFVSFDISGVKENLVADPTAERRANRVGERAPVPGIRNCSASAVLKLHGLGVETADTVQVPETALARVLAHCLGQNVRGYSTTLTGGTTAIPIVDDTTGILPGCMLAFEDTTSPTDQNEGIVHFRRVKSVNVGTKAVTLTGALPFTPAATDKVHGCSTIAWSGPHLVDAVAAGGTSSWFYKREQGNVDTDLLWELQGCVASLKLENLGRGALPTVGLDILVANFAHGGADGLTNVALAAPEGNAQLSMGTNVRMLISPTASTAEVEVDAADVSLDVGMQRKPTMSTTERLNRFDGLASYSYDPGKSMLTTKLTGYDDAWYAALRAGTTYRITLYQAGDGTGAGKGWCLHAPKARLVATPARADVDMIHGVSLSWQLVENDDTAGGSNEDLEMSRFVIALA